MSLPPQGGWQPPQQAGPPPNQGQSYGHQTNLPGYQPPPPGWQQGPWQQPSSPPPRTGSSFKWLLIATAVLLVIGISVGATLIFTRGGGGGTILPTSGAPSDIASANDTGPIAVITDEPTCQAYFSINNGLADAEANGWSDARATLGAVADWTAEQQSQVKAVVSVMDNASNQIVALAKQTPHRVVRELYQQFIAYARAYADSIPTYTPVDNLLADANVNIGSSLLGICNSITNSSTSRSLAIEPLSPPTRVAAPESPLRPQRFITTSDVACSGWVEREREFIAQTSAWSQLEPSIEGSQWTPEQRSVQLAVLPIISTMANDMEKVGEESGNPVFEDFALLGAQYFRSYVTSGEGYRGADSWLSYTGSRLNNAVAAACQATGG